MTITAGTNLGRYEIRSQLGAGGMGEVYLARDTQLDRSIALKILPADVASNSERMRRFVQEAKAAATLNHPNIAHIYEIGESGGTKFIAMEHVQGETLRHRLKHSGLRLGEALDVTTQIAAALTAAHRAGIIHRDLKPENVMLTPEGYVKVLDFGLAKLTEHPAANSAVSTLIDTDPGMIIGTAQYMSPEQARGLEMDARTDIWSLGVVLYEMVTGHAPFEGATKSDMIASILEREPRPLASHLPDLPPELWRIVRKALRKDREERYQTIKDLGLDVKNLRREMELEAELEYSAQPGSISGATAASGRHATLSGAAPGTAMIEGPHAASSAEYIAGELKRHKKGLFVAAAVAVFALAALGFGIYKYASRPSASSASMKLTKLTTDGKAGVAAISLDGRYVVHLVNGTEGFSLWMRQVATSSSVQIVPPSDKWFLGVGFSPDGNYIYYVAGEKNSPAFTLYQMPVLGGTPKKLLEDLATPVTISPDGKQAVFIRSDLVKAEDSLIIASLDGGKERKLATRKPPDYFVTDEGAPAWSPDGKSIAYAGYVFGSGRAYQINVFEVNVSDGTEKAFRSSQKWDWIDALAWLRDGSGLLLEAFEPGAQGSQIWQLSRSGEARRITNDLNNYYGIDLTADSSTLVTSQFNRTSNIWLVPGGDSSRARQITSGTNNYSNVDWTPDGKLVFVAQWRDIWIMDADGSGQKQLASERGNSSSVCAGRYIVFASNRDDVRRIWRMDMDGSSQKQLTSGQGDNFPNCSPDGKWVLYQNNSTAVPTIWKVPIDGGESVQLTSKFSVRPLVSPDGKLIAIRYINDPAGRKFGMALIPFEGGEPVKLFDISSFFVRWSRDGRALQYIDNRGGSSNIWSQPIDGGPPRQLTDFKSDRLFSFAWSTDGKQLAVSRGVDAEDVVLISNFR